MATICPCGELWVVEGWSGSMWGHPSINYNLPLEWVVANVVPLYVSQEFFIVERVWNKWPSTLLNTRMRRLTLVLTSWKSRMTLQRSEKKNKKIMSLVTTATATNHKFFLSKLLIYFIVYVMGMDCTYILSISYYGILHDIIFISYYITVLCMISYSYSHHIIFLCIILY